MNPGPNEPPEETPAEIPAPSSDPDDIAMREDVADRAPIGDADVDMMML